MFKKISVFLMLFVLLAVSCGKNSKKLVFMMWGDAEERTAVNRYLDEYKKTYKDAMDIQVIHLNSFAYWDKFQVMVAGGETPDVFYMGYEEIRAYKKQDVLENLTPYIKRDKMDMSDFYGKLIKGYTINDNLYGIPKDFTPLVLYYNKDLFDKKGIPYPDESWTWKDLRRVSMMLTKRKGNSVKRYGFIVEDWASWMPAWIWSNGGKYFNKAGQWVFGQAPYLKKNAEAYDFLVGMMLKDKSAPDVGARKSLGGSGAFTSNKVAMCVYGRWAVLQFKGIKRFKWGVAPIPAAPSGKRVTSIFTTAYSISKKSRVKKNAWRLVKFLTGKKAQRFVAESGQAVPSRKSVANSDYFLRSNEVNKYQIKLGNEINHQVFLDAMKYAKLPPAHRNWLAIRDALSQWFQSVFIGVVKAEKQLSQTQPKFQKLLY